jgi:hypothetical protein
MLPDEAPTPDRERPKRRRLLVCLVAAGVGLLVLLLVGRVALLYVARPRVREISWQEMRRHLRENRIRKLVIYADGSGAYSGEFRDGSSPTEETRTSRFVVRNCIPWPALPDDTKKDILDSTAKHDVTVVIKQPSAW